MTKKILYLSYDGMTDPLGQSQVIPYLSGLAENGYKITILSCEKKQRFALMETQIKKRLDEKGISWAPIFYHKRPPVLSTIWDLRSLKKMALHLHKKNHFSLVHCRSYIPSLVGLRLHKKNKIPFIFDMRGFWADERVDGNLWNLKNPIYKVIYNFFKKKEREFLATAASSISLTFGAKYEILRNNPASISPITIIPCCVDLDRFSLNNVDQSLKIKLKEKFNLGPENKVLLYLGSIGTWYLLDEMLDFFYELNRTHPHYRMLFVTQDNHEQIQQKATLKKIPSRAIILDSASHKDVPTYLALADVGISFIKPSYSKISSSPTKMGELLAMGVPLIANANVGDTNLLFSKYSIGHLLHGFSKTEYLKAIENIGKIENLNKEKIQFAARDYFSLIQGIEQYTKIYSEIVSV